MIKRSLSDTIRGSISDNAKDFLDKIGEKFKESNKPSKPNELFYEHKI